MSKTIKPEFDYVLDCSITMSWCFEDERSSYADQILEQLTTKIAIVPNIWSLEIANVLLIAERKKRIKASDVTAFIDLISGLPIVIDQESAARATSSVMSLARETHLTIYDAAYLEIAIREQIPIATLDKELIKAAHSCKVHVL